jgi:hypothetical protein
MRRRTLREPALQKPESAPRGCVDTSDRPGIGLRKGGGPEAVLLGLAIGVGG